MKKSLAVVAAFIVCCLCGILIACGDGNESGGGNENPKPCVQHTFGEWDIVKTATCTEKGERKHVCSVCKTEESEEIEVDKKNHGDHGFSAWTVTQAATCRAPGKRQHYCLGCNTVVTETIEADPTAHLYGPWSEIKPAYCREHGQKSRTCTYCSNVQTEDTDFDADNHKYKFVSKTESTCVTHGKEIYRCELCEQSDERELPLSSEHSFVASNGAANRCVDCGQLLTEQVKVTATASVGEVGYDLTLNGDFELKYEFVNHGGDNADGWHNWTFGIAPAVYDGGKLVVLSAQSLYMRARSNPDNTQGRYFNEHGVCTYTPDLNDTDGSAREFAKAMKDALCTATVVRNGNIVKVTVTSVSNVDGYGTYTYNAQFPIIWNDLNIKLSGESCVLDINRIALVSGNISAPTETTQPSGQELITSAVKIVNTDTREHNGYSVSLADGDFDIIWKFNNVGGGSMWHNYYFNVYKCFTTRGDDIGVMWALGACNEEATWGYTFTDENWTGVGLNGDSQYGYGVRDADFDELMKNGVASVRFIRKNGVLDVIGIVRTNDAAAKLISSVIFKTQGTAYNGPLTLRLMGENCTLDVASVKLVSGELCTAHKFGNWETVTYPVCSVDGQKKRVCTVCGTVETEAIPASGVHEFVSDSGVGEKCKHCDEILKSSKTIQTNGTCGAVHDGYIFTGDFETVYEFNNKGGDNGGAWHNWSLQTLPVDYANGKRVSLTPSEPNRWTIIRFRTAQGDGVTGLVAKYTPFAATDGDLTTEMTAAMRDADCVAVIKRVGSKITIRVTSVSKAAGFAGKTYLCEAEYEMVSDSVYVALSGENCMLTLNSVKCKNGTTFAPDTKSVQHGADQISESATYTNANREGNGYTLSLAEGDFDVAYELVNNGGTENNDGWHNFYFNLYKGVSAEKDKTNVLWTFAANGEEPDWEYVFCDGNIKSNIKFIDRPSGFVEKMRDATVCLRIVRKNGVITVLGASYTRDGTLIMPLCFVSKGTYTGAVSMRIMSEKSSFTLQHVYLDGGTVAE